jgi:hypothetical protein
MTFRNIELLVVEYTPIADPVRAMGHVLAGIAKKLSIRFYMPNECLRV